MDDYISREAVVRYLKGYSEKELNWNRNHGMVTSSVLDKAERAISEMPAADVQPVKYGRWIYGENDDGQDGIFCSECEHFVPWFYEYYDKSDDLINDNPRCPRCGSKNRMDGGGE